MTRKLVVLCTALGLFLGVFALPASAEICQSGGDYNIDCTQPDTWGSCGGPNQNLDTEWINGYGLLELRWDSGCRSVWARMDWPGGSGTGIWARRGTWFGCKTGSTRGGPSFFSSVNYWSWQLNDKNCLARAMIWINATGAIYATEWE